MKNFIKKIKNQCQRAAISVQTAIATKKAEGYVDSGVKILIAVVLGALLLAGLYALFGEVVMPTLTQRIRDMFNYGGAN